MNTRTNAIHNRADATIANARRVLGKPAAAPRVSERAIAGAIAAHRLDAVGKAAAAAPFDAVAAQREAVEAWGRRPIGAPARLDGNADRTDANELASVADPIADQQRALQQWSRRPSAA